MKFPRETIRRVSICNRVNEAQGVTYEFFILATVGNLDVRLASLVNDLEREVLDIGLDFSIAELATNETLRVEDSVVGVHRDLVLRGVADQPLIVGEGDV